MDGVEAFVDGGPIVGKRVNADVILAGTDRIAIRRRGRGDTPPAGDDA